MEFHAEHRFAAPPGEVAALLGDPAFHRGLVLPDVGTPEVVGQDDDGRVATLRLRYEFTGSLDPFVRRILGRRRLAWIQSLRVDRGDGRGRLEFAAEAAPKRLHGHAAFLLEPDGGGTRRRLEGELVVSVPGIGRGAEGRVVPGLLRRLDLEAEALRAALAA